MMRVKPASSLARSISDVEVAKLMARARPAFAKVGAGGDKAFARMRPHLAAIEARLRRAPKVAAGLDAIAGTWMRLVEGFCEAIDPVLSRYFPDLRLVATLDADGAAKLHRIARDDTGRTVATLEPANEATLGATKWRSIELRLRPEQVLQRTLALPGASREFLAPILDHRMERLTPWTADKVVYGYRIVESTAADTTLTIELVATSRDIIAGPMERLAALGLSPTAIGAETPTLTQPLNLLLQAIGARPSGSRAYVSRIAIATLTTLALLVAVTAMVSSIADGAREETAARLVKARRLLRNASLGGIGGPEQIMLDAKRPDRAMVVLVDRLAASIPPDTFLKELAVTPDKLRLVGLSGNAPALVGKLEATGLANVRFASGVTREKDGRDHFEIVAERRFMSSGGTP